ncbi:MAG: allantoinase AllB [Candidatus Obscuribacterales bacterium]|nr:allantoinase AllB [Candidatus Obscuribacterales bacterium]
MPNTNNGADYGLYSKRVITPVGEKEAVVLVNNGKISDIVSLDSVPAGCPVEDLNPCVLMPGLVDSHVHVNEPGRVEWEGFRTATRSAAAGGITTIADMPLNCIPVTTTVESFKTKLPTTEDQLWIDCAFYGGVVPGNEKELEALIDMGVLGFKCFLIHSGIDEFPNTTEEDLRRAMPILAKRKVPLLVHAELECEHDHIWNDPCSYKDFLASRPRIWENEAIKLMIKLCREFSCPVHIVHLSSSDALSMISQAKKEGLPFSVESCPHYLTLEAESIPDGDPRYKCAPPIRERENKEKLWNGLTAGLIDFVVSDHSPCVPGLKHLDTGDLQKAWGGISSLQFGLPVIWSEARQRGLKIENVVEWMCEKPAQFLNLNHKKGKLAAGFDADIVVFNPDKKFAINKDVIQHKNKVTPYEGRELYGVVERTYVRGNLTYQDGRFAANPCGKQVLRQNAEIKR